MPFQKYPAPLKEDDEALAESGRLFVRNLAFACTEAELRELFSQYGAAHCVLIYIGSFLVSCFSQLFLVPVFCFPALGPLAEVHMPIDSETKQTKAIAFVTYTMPQHAVTALSELDGTVFQGRLLHILPARQKRSEAAEAISADDPENTNYKKVLRTWTFVLLNWKEPTLNFSSFIFPLHRKRRPCKKPKSTVPLTGIPCLCGKTLSWM